MMSTAPNIQTMTEKELQGYCQWLAELQEEAEDAGNFADCDAEVWEQFDPAGPAGDQIYQSISDEKLLDVLIGTMEGQGRKPRCDRLHPIYRRYLQLRFGGLNNAKERARVRAKLLEEEAKWPPDWHTRVSVDPLLVKLEGKGRQVTAEERELLERLCREARETGLPPAVSIPVRDRLNKLMDHKSVLEAMGIPCLSNASLKRMTRYWAAQRKNGPEDTEG